MVLVVLVGIGVAGSLPPAQFPTNSIVHIDRNMGLTAAAQTLMDRGVIRSAFLFKVLVVLLGGHTHVQAGDYRLGAPVSTLTIALRTIHGDERLQKVKITIPEGTNTYEIAWIILRALPQFNASAFLALAKPHEGYLFPDTYFFYENVRSDEVVKMMMDTFDAKVMKNTAMLKDGDTITPEVIKIASLIEREASKPEDRRIVAGILWKRIAVKMPLQVDASFSYIFGETTASADLTASDLAIDSPYNLYKHAGLPPTAINNPGLDAIDAALHPTDTKNWYYLSDKQGIMHYAETLAQHAANKRKYL